MSDKLLVDLDRRGIATMTLNRPDALNTYDQEMIEDLGAAIERLGSDTAVRVIVLRGKGRLFSAGADVRWHGSRSKPAPGEPEPLSVFDVCDRLRTVAHPSVAVVHGACIGGALAIASSCDILIAATNAFFSIPEVRLGFSPGIQSGPTFARAIGVRNFRRYAMTGQRLGAEEALRMGLAHHLAAPQDLEQALAEQIEEILLAAPQAARGAKLMAERLTPPVPMDALKDIAHLFGGPLASPEAEEGRRSFMEKRKPNWYPKP